MKDRLMLFVAVVAGLVATVLTFVYIDSTTSEDDAAPVRTLEVLFTINDIPANSSIDADADPQDLENALFRWLSNADPVRDRVERGARMGFDARRKTPGRDDRGGVPVRDYPPLVSMSPEIVERVDARWNEYGFNGDPSPSRFVASDR